MHRQIMKTPKGIEVDHKNCIRLDNRKENLTKCIHQENTFNTTMQVKSKTGYKGVQYNGYSFIAAVRKSKSQYHLGSYDTAIEAAKAYNEKAKELFGEFAKLNDLEKI